MNSLTVKLILHNKMEKLCTNFNGKWQKYNFVKNNDYKTVYSKVLSN